VNATTCWCIELASAVEAQEWDGHGEQPGVAEGGEPLADEGPVLVVPSCVGLEDLGNRAGTVDQVLRGHRELLRGEHGSTIRSLLGGA
jgi:hypothetical protein